MHVTSATDGCSYRTAMPSRAPMMFPNGLFPRLCNPAADLSRQTASQKDKLTFSYGAHKIASAMSRTTF